MKPVRPRPDARRIRSWVRMSYLYAPPRFCEKNAGRRKVHGMPLARRSCSICQWGIARLTPMSDNDTTCLAPALTIDTEGSSEQDLADDLPGDGGSRRREFANYV